MDAPAGYTSFQAHLIYALAWLSFGAVHSVLAGSALKKRLETLLKAYYRLSYNLLAVFHIGLVFWLGRAMLSAQPYALEPGVGVGLTGIKVLGGGGPGIGAPGIRSRAVLWPQSDPRPSARSA